MISGEWREKAKMEIRQWKEEPKTHPRKTRMEHPSRCGRLSRRQDTRVEILRAHKTRAQDGRFFSLQSVDDNLAVDGMK